MSAPGWHPDPTGRFSQRWFDGNDWSAYVVGANGQTISDPISAGAASDAPPAPPAAPASAPAGVPSPPPASPPPTSPPNAPGQPAYPAPPPAYVPRVPAYPPNSGQPAAWSGSAGAQTASGSEARYRPGVGLAISALGIVLVLLSLFVLKWATGDHSAFSDIHSAASKSSGG